MSTPNTISTLNTCPPPIVIAPPRLTRKTRIRRTRPMCACLGFMDFFGGAKEGEVDTGK